MTMKYPLDLREQDERMYRRGWDDADKYRERARDRAWELIAAQAEIERLRYYLKQNLAGADAIINEPERFPGGKKA